MFDTLAHLFSPRHTNNHRPGILHPVGLAVLMATVLISHSGLELLKLVHPQGLVLGFASNISSSQIIDSINVKRSENGLQPLNSNSKLEKAAYAKARHMFSVDYWDHIAPDGTTPWFFIKDSGYKYAVAGENLARDFDTTSPMIDAWMASPTHKANILHAKYTDTGIAVVNGQLNGVETTLVVQMFGSPTPTAAAPAAPQPTPAITETAPAPVESEIFTQEVNPNVPVVLAETQTTPTTLVSPLDFKRSIALSTLGLVAGVILIDELLINRKKTIRFVGRNLAHLGFLAMIVLIMWSLTQPGGIL